MVGAWLLKLVVGFILVLYVVFLYSCIRSPLSSSRCFISVFVVICFAVRFHWWGRGSRTCVCDFELHRTNGIKNGGKSRLVYLVSLKVKVWKFSGNKSQYIQSRSLNLWLWKEMSNNLRKRTFWHMCHAKAQITLRICTQTLRCSHVETWLPWLSKIHQVKFLIRLGECAGWSESLLCALVWRYVFSYCGSNIISNRLDKCLIILRRK